MKKIFIIWTATLTIFAGSAAAQTTAYETDPAQTPEQAQVEELAQNQQPRPRSILFWGISDKMGRPEMLEMAQEIRNLLSLDPNIRLIDGLTVARITREKDRLGQESMDNSLPPDASLPDSTLTIRGIVEDMTLTIRRHLLFWGKIDAQMTVKFSISGLNGEDAYHGEFSGNASKVKDFILFRSAPKVIHISAIDRKELTEKIQSQIVRDMVKTTAQYLNSLTAEDETDTETNSEETDPLQESEPVADTQDTSAIDPNADFSDVLGEDTETE